MENKILIDRNSLIDILSKQRWDEPKHRRTIMRSIELVMKQPKVDAVPVVHGHWILEREPDGKPYCFHCSACDGDFHYIGISTAFDYCPNCGARMDGAE